MVYYPAGSSHQRICPWWW